MNLENMLICPSCRDDVGPALAYSGGDILRCTRCGSDYSIVDEIINLEKNEDLDTMLDIDAYEHQNKFSEAYSTQLYASSFRPFLTALGIEPSKCSCLEIASGSGNLTQALAGIAGFRDLYSSDISVNFLKLQRKRISKYNMHFLRFDANYIPFMPCSIDVIMGHSVLHHFLHYERSLYSAYRVLRNGGVAIFGEPMYPGHAITSLMAGFILQADLMLPEPERYPKKALHGLQVIKLRTSEKQYLMHHDREALSSREDKLQFSCDGMKALSRKIGFSRFMSLSELIAEAPRKPKADGGKHVKLIEDTISNYSPGFSLKKHKNIIEIFDQAYFTSYCQEPPPLHFSHFAFVK